MLPSLPLFRRLYPIIPRLFESLQGNRQIAAQDINAAISNFTP